MGGFAFKQKFNLICDRISEKEMMEIYNKIYNQTINKFSDVNISLVDYVKEKKDFGDIDILIDYRGDYQNLLNFLNTFSYNNIWIKNGNIFSIAYRHNSKIVEIDFINESFNNWNLVKLFYNYDPFGNLMGKITRQLNIKFKPSGLKFYYLFFGKEFKKEYKLTDNPDFLFKLFGLSIDKYKQGFNTYIDLYNFLSDSPFIHKKMFYSETLNNDQRKRDLKRGTYQKFLEWLKSKNNNIPLRINRKNVINYLTKTFNINIDNINSNSDKPFNQDEIFSIIIQIFPEIKEQVGNDYKKINLIKKQREKLNVKIYGEYFNWTKKDYTVKAQNIAEKIKEFKELYNDETYWDNSQEIIFKDFLSFYKK